MSQWATIDSVVKNIFYQVIYSNVIYSCAVLLQILSGRKTWRIAPSHGKRISNNALAFHSPLVLQMEWIEPLAPRDLCRLKQ